AVPLAVSIAMTRQAPLGRISRLSLRSIHHRCRRTSKASGLRSLASMSASWVSTLAGSSAMVRTGSPDGWLELHNPNGRRRIEADDAHAVQPNGHGPQPEAA